MQHLAVVASPDVLLPILKTWGVAHTAKYIFHPEYIYQELNMSALGTHTLIELWGCNQAINDVETIRTALVRAVDAASATLIELHVHQFSPQGVTGVAILAESHMSLHSWPEHDYLAADFFTCGTTCQPENVLAVFNELFEPDDVEVKTIPRGVRSE